MGVLPPKVHVTVIMELSMATVEWALVVMARNN